MPKNIILLSDGTGNSASKLFKTNVWRLYQSLDLSETGPGDPSRQKQIAYYDDGVGTSSFKPLAILGGAFGWGTKRNVLDLYTFLCRHYQQGDSIYGFGFSRGAFTIRVLTGLISSEGLVVAETEGERRHLAAEAFRAYRAKHYNRSTFITTIFRSLRNVLLLFWYWIRRKKSYTGDSNIKNVKIKFLGVWDTVAAYGLPIDELTHAWNFIFPLSFPDRNLSDIVDCAYHAVAIDDERLTFHPELWNEKEDDYKNRKLEDRLTQVWFAGMHSNLGGGYPDDGLSLVTLNWMMDKTESLGLTFSPDERRRLRELASIKGKKYDSRRGLGGAYRYMPRKIYELTHDNVEGKKGRKDKNVDRVVIETPKIHESVFKRIEGRVDGYAPIGLPEQYEVVPIGSAITTLPEDPIQAKDRANRQEKLWNLVWWKRVVYFMTVFVFISLAAFPFYLPVTEVCESRFCFLSPLIGSLGAFLPGFLGNWIKAYQSHPGFSLLIVAVLAGLLFCASVLQRKIFDSMRIIFDDKKSMNPAASPAGALYNFRTNKALQNISKFWKEKALPAFILAVVLVIAFYGASRILFTVIDSLGIIGTPTPNLVSGGKLENGTFNTRNLCWASGVKADKGKSYKITLTIIDDPKEQWADNGIDGFGLGGFGKEKMSPLMYTGLPFRRNLKENWFKPIARIGGYGDDDYPLNPVDGAESNDKMLISVIKARREGEIFLYINDAVLPVPNAWQPFYGNNHGNANVKIEPLY